MVLSGVPSELLQRAVQSKTTKPRWAAYLPKQVMPIVWHQHQDGTQEHGAPVAATCDHYATSSVHNHGTHVDVHECGELVLQESHGAVVAPALWKKRTNVPFSDTPTTVHTSSSFDRRASSSFDMTEHSETPTIQSQASFDSMSCSTDTGEVDVETIVVERNTFLTVELLQRHRRRLNTTPA
jgi:hypothetical protein